MNWLHANWQVVVLGLWAVGTELVANSAWFKSNSVVHLIMSILGFAKSEIEKKPPVV